MSRPCPRSLRPVVFQDLPWRGTWWQSGDWQGEAADLGGLRLYPLAAAAQPPGAGPDASGC